MNALFLFFAAKALAAPLAFEVHGVEEDVGTVRVALFDSARPWPGNLPAAVAIAVGVPEDGVAIVRFPDLPPGRYAATLWHDADDDGQIGTNFLGMPVEGVGASNDAKGFMGPPPFERAAFELPAEGAVLRAKLAYLF